MAVRGAPILNDATVRDARAAGLDGIVEVIDNGSDAPGTILGECSTALRERFARASLIVAKGQGNFESLSAVRAPVYFLFVVKCPLVAARVGLPVGTPVVVHRWPTFASARAGLWHSADRRASQRVERELGRGVDRCPAPWVRPRREIGRVMVLEPALIPLCVLLERIDPGHG